MKLASHPLWLVGFRPFFSLACLAGLSLPLLWALMFGGALPAPAGRFTPVQWHAHEMFFGFGWAVMGGFLLTASKNWVQIRGYHGAALMWLVAAWLFERVGMAWGGAWPAALFWLSNTVFLGSIVAMLLWTLIRYRSRDSFRDNYFFLVALPLFLAAKLLLLDGAHFQAGVAMAVGLFRVAFLVMLERTLTQFMKGVFQVDILRDPMLDLPIKLMALSLVFVAWMPKAMAGALLVALAFLLVARLVFWKPQFAMRRIELAVMYLGYAAIASQLLLEFIALHWSPGWVGSLPVHVFTFGVMGLIIPAMLVRISKGHTGRKVVFDAGDKLVLWLMIGAFVARVVLPQLAPGMYTGWIHLSATAWFACFAILGWRYIPFLLAPRVDGKEH
ncbi:NnrS family protein [Aromatoleum petrolei]|uniref:NnrS family protein n=1 Tax=Aromatoleum petrolei TaxID=76116 RepID=A0ABX1MR67_9RHOO|nr:NnrS family protein [Aromatoleum petrolei]NMF90288.1 NnrS family protein [Aromatoleum petrolei]QTQ35562.1 NnrS-like protein [Aromatoleum petrolei]